jgi:CheY-like chemotaxis protein
MHVLVVEDEPIFRLDLTNRLRSLGFETVHGTAYAEEAVVYAQSHTPDLILMDIRLKGEMTGIEAAGRIGSGSSVPILIMSAYHYEPQELASTVPNFLGFLPKPIDDVSLETYCGKVVQH